MPTLYRSRCRRVSLNEDLVREHPRRTIHFDLFRDDWHLRQAERAHAAGQLVPDTSS